MYPQMLHKFFMLDLFPAFVVALDLIFQFLDPVSFISIFLHFFSSKVVPIKQLLLK